MGLRLDGRNSLAYLGIRPQQVPNIVIKNSRPTTIDVMNFSIGDLWVIPKRATTPSQELWQLVDNAQNVATWNHIGASTGELDLRKITGDSGGAILPNSSNNINVIGSGVIDITGTALSNTLTISMSAASSGVKTRQITMTSAQIKDSLNTPVEIVAAPGVNKIIAPISIVLWYQAGSNAGFDNSGGDLWVTYTNNGGQILLGRNAYPIPNDRIEMNYQFMYTGGLPGVSSLFGFAPNFIAGSGMDPSLMVNQPLVIQQQALTPAWTGNASNDINIVIRASYVILDT